MADDFNSPVQSESYPVTPGEDVGSDVSSLEEAGKSLTESREAPSGERPIDIIDYRDEHGEVSTDRSPLSLREAARGRAEYRNAVVANREQGETQRVSERVESLRQPEAAPQYTPSPNPQGGDPGQPHKFLDSGTREQWLAEGPRIQEHLVASQNWLAQLEQKIGEAASAGESLDTLYQHRAVAISHVTQGLYYARIVAAIHGGTAPELAVPFSQPGVMEAQQQWIAQWEQHYTQAIAFACRTAEDCYLRSQTAMLAMWPELKGAIGNVRNLEMALNVIRARDPRRADTIKGWLAYMEKVYTNWKSLQWQQSQRQQQAAQTFIQQNDALFSERRPETKSASFSTQMGKDTMSYLESLGATRAEVVAAWHSPAFRNHINHRSIWTRRNTGKRKAPCPRGEGTRSRQCFVQEVPPRRRIYATLRRRWAR
jgi:hypothetical protein